MIALRRILCPVDFSDTSERALTHAAAFATWYDARLTVLHVAAACAQPLEAGSHADLISRLHRSIEQAGATGVKATPLVRQGRAADAIVDCAAELKVDLLVMGTHGLSGFRRLLLGSVTEKVARIATCPVLTVPPAAPAAAPRPIMFKKILCPIDDSPSALKALEYALELGRQAGGCVTVLHALEYLDPEDYLEPSVFDPCRDARLESHRLRQRRMDDARDRLHARLAGESRTGCAIDEVVAINRAYKEILQRAAAAETDLIVMGAHGSAVAPMLYGSNTHHVVRAATCPVLTVRA